jgi:hypothetical protein
VEKAEQQLRIAVSLISLAILGWTAWSTLLRDDQRARARMAAADTARRAAAAAAAWAGRRGIAAEAAAGREADAAGWYQLAAWLTAGVAGAAQRAYDRARSTG